MAGRIKHMERSHKTHKSGGSEFRRFAMKANWARDQKEQRKSLIEVVKGMLHKKQDR